MVRPKKLPEELRSNKMTIYLTDYENDLVSRLAEGLTTQRTQVVLQALRQYANDLMKPSRVEIADKHERVMYQSEEAVRGYMCRNGHVFWVEWSSPKKPTYCPECGADKGFKATWDGDVIRELRK